MQRKGGEYHWTDRVKKGERVKVFGEVFATIHDDSKDTEERIKIFFENISDEDAFLFLQWIMENEYLQYFMDELLFNFSWVVVVGIIQKIDPDEKYNLAKYVT